MNEQMNAHTRDIKNLKEEIESLKKQVADLLARVKTLEEAP